MALPEVSIPIPFVGGLDTKSDPKAVAPLKLLALENGVFTRGGTIAKRTGYEALSRALDEPSTTYVTDYSRPRALAARDDELVLFADRRLYSYRPSSDTWSDGGPCLSVVHTERPLAHSGTAQTMPDRAALRGLAVLAWEDSRGGVWWSVTEEETGRVLRTPAQLDANGSRPRCCAVGGVLHVYYAIPAALQIWVAVVNPDAFTGTITPSVLIDDLSAAVPSYDAAPTSYDTTLLPGVIAWSSAAGGWRVAYVHSSGVLGSPVTGLPSAATYAADTVTGGVAVTWRPSCVAVAWGDATNARLRRLTSNALATPLSSSVACTAAVASFTRVTLSAYECQNPPTTIGTLFFVLAEEPGSSDRDSIVTYNSVHARPSATIVVGTQARVRGHGLATRAWTCGLTDENQLTVDREFVCATLVHAVPNFGYAAVVRLIHEPLAATNSLHTIARLAPGEHAGLPTRVHLSSAAVVAADTDANTWAFPIVAKRAIDADPAGNQRGTSGIRLVTIDVDNIDAYQTAQFGPELVIAGGLAQRYDSDRVAELGFHCAPDGTITATPSAGGSLTPSGVYSYVVTYEEEDALGLLHRGPTSIPIEVTMGGADTRVTIAIPTYRLTDKRRVRIAVWRSERNVDAGYWRVTSLDPTATGSNGFLVNDTTVDTVSFVDDLSDANLLLREPLYTTGGTLSNDPVPTGHVLVGGKDRLFFNDAQDPYIVRHSQAQQDGVACELSIGLGFRVDRAGGEVSALAVLDDAVLVFQPAAIQFVAGPGPLPNPTSAPQIGFSPAQLITADVGCTAPRSVATTADRVLFQTSRGLYQIDRSRQVAYVGAPVEAYNAQRVTSADGIPGRTQVVFTTDSGAALLYDYYYDQWATWTNHEALDAVVVDGEYHYLRANDVDLRVFRRDSTSYLDAGTSIRLYLETAWIKMQGYCQGWQRAWWATLLGEYVSSHVLQVKVATDYQHGWGEPYEIAVDDDYDPAVYGAGAYGAGTYGGDSDSVYQQRIHVSLDCQAIRFAIGELATPPPQGASFELTELLLTGGVKRPAAPLPGARSQ